MTQEAVEKLGYEYSIGETDQSETTGNHGVTVRDMYCGWVAKEIKMLRGVEKILDVGSYITFVEGLGAGYDVTAIDIRKIDGLVTPNIRFAWDITRFHKSAPFRDGQFDVVTSLSVIEHVGVGAYGTKVDVDGDDRMIKNINHWTRMYGNLILTTQQSDKPKFIQNVHRIYSIGILERLIKRNGFEIIKAEGYTKQDEWNLLMINAIKIKDVE